MITSGTAKETQYPGWPRQFKDIKFEASVPQKTERGEGLLFSDDVQLMNLDQGPHPEEVKLWRNAQKATVSVTAEHFGLSGAQVLEACERPRVKAS